LIKNIIITGIGGQGVLYLSAMMRKLLAVRYEAVSGYDNRGGAQRLGHVSSAIRYFADGSDKHMAIDFADGACDFLIALEASEALRFNAKVSKRTIVIMDEFIIPPTNIRRSDSEYFKLDEIRTHFEKIAGTVIVKNFREISAGKFGGHLYANLLMFGEFIKNCGGDMPLEFVKDMVAEADLEKIRYGCVN